MLVNLVLRILVWVDSAQNAFIALGLPAGRREKAGIDPAPPRCIATGLGARVARLRCPILLASMAMLSERNLMVNTPLVAGESGKRKILFIIKKKGAKRVAGHS